MEKRRVLLLGAQRLLVEGLQTILSKLDDVELIGPWDLDSSVLFRLPEEAPDLVLVADDGGQHESVAFLTSQIMEQHPELPIVWVGLKEKAMRLYSSHTLPARTADLVEAIRSLPAH